jgi:hypothetical protein
LTNSRKRVESSAVESTCSEAAKSIFVVHEGASAAVSASHSVQVAEYVVRAVSASSRAAKHHVEQIVRIEILLVLETAARAVCSSSATASAGRVESFLAEAVVHRPFLLVFQHFESERDLLEFFFCARTLVLVGMVFQRGFAIRLNFLKIIFKKK